MGMLDWLFGPTNQEAEPVPPRKNFPTQEEADSARKSGMFYGTPMEPFAGGLAGMYLADQGQPIPGDAIGFDQLTDPGFSKVFDQGLVNAPNAAAVPDVYARSALAANRSAIASLGMDPRRFAMDAFLPAEKMNIGGMYSPDTDRGFVIPGASPDAASTLTHESAHRGMQKLRDSGTYPEKSSDDFNISEEDLVSLIMRDAMGDPEQSELALKRKEGLEGRYLDNARQQLKRIEDAAAALFAKKHPSGPR
jgi:hypothetical protein